MFTKGYTPWNKGTKGLTTPWNKGKNISEASKEKIKRTMKSKNIKIPRTIEGEIKRLKSLPRGEEHWKWRGGVSRSEINKNWISRNRKQKYFLNVRRRINKNGAIGSHSLLEWENLKASWNYICLCCKRSEPDIFLTEDHIVPLSNKGTDNIDNIQPLCQSCNSIKKTKSTDYRFNFI